jgi:hypothetical protein
LPRRHRGTRPVQGGSAAEGGFWLARGSPEALEGERARLPAWPDARRLRMRGWRYPDDRPAP